MFARHDRAAPGIALLSAVVLLGTGCKSGPPADNGIRIGDRTLAEFKPKQTSEPWLIAVIGPPTTRTEVCGDRPASVLRYSVIERAGGGVLSFLFGSAPPKTTATIYFIVENGIVMQFWADREEESTFFGGKKTKDTGEKKD